MGLASEASVATRQSLARLAAIVAGMVLFGALAGCGVRGNLETPPDAKVAGTPTAPDATDAGGNSAVKPKPHKGFILDGLLR
jgi:predicted small lipoprotein YifL